MNLAHLSARRASSFKVTCWSIVLAMPLAVTSGCGMDEVKSATAKGKVTHAGQPVTEGVVHFLAPQTGFGGSSPLDASGDYKITQGMPPGTYKVYVAAPSPAMTGVPGGPPPAINEYPNIPAQFRSDMSSGLTATVKAGENTFDFKLD